MASVEAGVIVGVTVSRITIRSNTDGGKVEVPADAWKESDGSRPRIGDVVEFVRDERRRRAAVSIRRVASPVAEAIKDLPPELETRRPELEPRRPELEPRRPEPKPRRPDAAEPVPKRPGGSYLQKDRFLNPYNFVRPLPFTREKEPADPAARLLGRCPPPPLDRCLGVSGELTCRIRAEGPVFVSDSHEVVTDEKGHRSYRFLRAADGRPCIPGSALRGVVRSVFEAATNSCWELMGDRLLSRRITAKDARRLVPARLVRKGDEWTVELLTGTTGYHPYGPPTDEPLYAAWVLRYEKVVQKRRQPPKPGWVVHGTHCWARVRRAIHEVIDRSDKVTSTLQIWNVEKFGRSEADVTTPEVDGSSVLAVEGHYHDYGKNIKKKHDERFFFARPGPLVVPTSADTVKRYVALLEDYRELHSRDTGRKPDPGTYLSGFISAGPRSVEACAGELLYALLDKNSDPASPVVLDLAPVSVPRMFWKNPISARFPDLQAVTPCSVHNAPPKQEEDEPAPERTPANTPPPHLCPACRVFGWVARGGEGEAQSGAVRSRVRFGDALFPTDAVEEDEWTLPILSAPKPTTLRFYLMPKSLEVRHPERSEANIDYDKKSVVVRGRKFYRRHGDGDLPEAEPNGQNRTLRDHLVDGAETTFRVRFENLAEVELGALLWALELDDHEWVHRLGYGKPLGLGNVRIDIQKASLVEPDRYASETIPAAPLQRDALRAWAARLTDRFRSAMVQRYAPDQGDAVSFDKLSNVADLRGLLRDVPRLEVGYPRLDTQPRGAQETYLWFTVNRDRRHPRWERAPRAVRDALPNRGAGLGYWLDLADGDTGLPYDPSQ